MAIGRRKLLFYLVLMPRISLLVYTNSYSPPQTITENIYCECKGHISNFLNNCLQESLNLDLVMIRIIRFLI